MHGHRWRAKILPRLERIPIEWIGAPEAQVLHPFRQPIEVANVWAARSG
jgi:hypothetical protein